MCGRFTLTSIPDSFAQDFELDEIPDLDPRYNIAPTQDILVVRRPDGGGSVELASVRWGLVPAWSDGPAGPPLINARAETVDRKPSFQDSFLHRRCLIPADGYYEWRSSGGYRQPYHIRLRDRGLFTMAGLWDRWGAAGLNSGAIVTTAANDLTRDIHDRMPLILTPEAGRVWLSPSSKPDELRQLLVPFTSGRMEVEAVAPRVNSVANDGPECLQPAEVNLELEL